MKVKDIYAQIITDPFIRKYIQRSSKFFPFSLSIYESPSKNMHSSGPYICSSKQRGNYCRTMGSNFLAKLEFFINLKFISCNTSLLIDVDNIDKAYFSST